MQFNMFSRSLVAFLVLGSFFNEAESVLKTTFLEDLCFSARKSTIDLQYENSGILMSVPMRNYVQDMDCEVLLLPPSGKSVVLSILRYDVGTNEELIIEDADRHAISLLGRGYFKDEKKSIVSDGKIWIRYRVVNKTSDSPNAGFQFTYTKVGSAPCNTDEFKCKNGKCLSRDYTCDGHNHCGDRSEQTECSYKITDDRGESQRYNSKFTPTLAITLVVVSSVILFIIIVVLTVVVVRHVKAKKAIKQQNAATPLRGGNIPLQSVATPETQQAPAAANSVQQQAQTAQQPSLYNRLRQSFRGPRVEQVHHHQAAPPEVYQVPAMYPSLDQLPSAPAMYGIQNPDFKTEV